MANKIFIVYKSYDGYENTMIFWTPDENVAKEFCDKKMEDKTKYENDVKFRAEEYLKWRKEKNYPRKTHLTQHDESASSRILVELTRLMSNKPDISKIPEDRHQKVLGPWQKKVDELNKTLDDMKLEVMRIIDGTNKEYNDKMDEEFDEKFPVPQRPNDLENDYIGYYYREVTDEVPG